MNKPKLFIGSSSESKIIAEKIKCKLENFADVQVWYRDTFQSGDYILETLNHEILRSDFALLVVFPDDEITKRNEYGYTARDNVIFELGLFVAALGRHRVFYLAVTDNRKLDGKKAQIPSDVSGLNLLTVTWNNDDQLDENLEVMCSQIKQQIIDRQNTLGVGLLPSTPIAIGYYNNFIVEVCNSLYHSKSFECNGKTYNFDNTKFTFNVVLPEEERDASHQGFLKFKDEKKLEPIQVTGHTKARQFSFYVDLSSQNDCYTFYDYATTLNSAMEAISLATPEITITKKDHLIHGEVENFERTLKHLLKQRKDSAHFYQNISIIPESQLT